MKSFSFTIKGNRMEQTISAYEPFAGAPFVVHRPIGNGSGPWVVTHRNTTMIAGHGMKLSSALTVAAGLASKCPSAARVRLKRDAEGTELAGHLTGPHRKLKAEIKAFHQAMA